MSIIISPNPTKKNIRVGYIDPELGYVDNVSIRQANKYARNNPGTSFIFVNGDNNVNYLNINQVNELTGQELLPTNPCEGIKNKPVRPPIIQFSGGGGIGAFANGVIGEDGSILAVDLESGGNGYQYPPTVFANDFSGSGSGAVFRVILDDGTGGGPGGSGGGPGGTGGTSVTAGGALVTAGGTGGTPVTAGGGGTPVTAGGTPLTAGGTPLTAGGAVVPRRRDFETVLDCSALNEILEDYEDFEDDVVDFGRVYDQTGQEIGPWNPRIYVRDLENPFRTELKVSNTPIDTQVTHFRAIGELNRTTDISLTWSPTSIISNITATDDPLFRSYIIDFKTPVSSTTIVTFLKQGAAEGRPFPNLEVQEYTRISSTRYRLRFGGLLTTPEQQQRSGADFSYSFCRGFTIRATSGESRLNSQERTLFWNTRKRSPDRIRSGSNSINPSRVFEVEHPTWNEFMNGYAISPVSPSNVNGSDYTGVSFALEWDESFPYDGPYIFRGLADNVSTLYIDNQRIGRLGVFNGGVTPLRKVLTGGQHTIKLELLNTFQSYVDTQVTHFRAIGDLNATTDISLTWSPTSIISNITATDDPLRRSYIIEFNAPVSNTYVVTFLKQGAAEGRPFPALEVQEYTRISSTRYRLRFGGLLTTPETQQRIGADFSFSFCRGFTIRVEQTTETSNWNINPMGVALRIDAPPPPTPILPPAPQEGPCPPNPFWSTRSPIGGGSENLSRTPIDTRVTHFRAIGELNRTTDISLTWSPASLISKITASDLPLRRSYIIDFNTPVSSSRVTSFLKQGAAEGRPFPNLEVQEYTRISSTRYRLRFGGALIPQDTQVTHFRAIGELNRTTDISLTWSPTSIISNITATDDPLFRSYIIDFKTPVSSTTIVTFLKQGAAEGRPFPNLEVQEYTRISSTRYRLRFGGLLTTGEFAFSFCRGFTIRAVPAGQSAEEFAYSFCRGFTIQATPGGSQSQNQWFLAIHPTWSKFMNRYAISPVPTLNTGSRAPSGVIFKNSWTIDAPYSGVYGFRGTADHIGKFFVDGREIARLQSSNIARPETIRFNLSEGRHTVSIELESNPAIQGVSLIGISAVIIACCPKRVGGKGVVVEVIPEEPGNNYLPPSVQGPADPTYQVSLVLDDVIIENPGINYSPEDSITITPDNGASLEFETDNFGRITNVNVLNPGFGFTTYPTIRISTASGGVNAKFIPKLKVIRDPIVVDESKLIQVTDLVGIKQTGYIDGRPYFGAVFYENNIKYAGFYETVGDLVQVYDTLKESIDAQVTTPPSAIQRQGTDVTSNDPRLNIPGTPQNLI
jgi:hypothetical protein